MPAVFTIPTILTYGTVYCGVFAYTEKLRNTMNPDTKELWTRAERTAEAQRLYPRAALCLAAEFLEDESLRTIGRNIENSANCRFPEAPSCGQTSRNSPCRQLGCGCPLQPMWHAQRSSAAPAVRPCSQGTSRSVLLQMSLLPLLQ